MGKDAILWMSLKHLIKIVEYRQYSTNEENGAISSSTWHLSTLNNQVMLSLYFYKNKVYFPIGTSLETDAFK